MSNNKLSPDLVQAELDRLRNVSRTRARRLRSAGSLVVSLCLLLFLTLSMFAAKTLWDGLHAPVLIGVLIGVLAASMQQVMGIAINQGWRRRRARYQLLWWAAMLTSGATLVLLAV